MKKLLRAITLLAFVSVFTSAAYSQNVNVEEECRRFVVYDEDCINFYAELGRANFEILREIRDNYVDEIGFQKLVDAFRKGGIKGVFALLDPHSKYVTAEERSKEEEADRPFGGVGMKFHEVGKKIIVFGFVEGGPAMRAGKIKKGDIILAVGDKSATGASSDAVAGWIRGEVGKDVAIKFRRENASPAEFIVILRRELIQLPVFTAKVFGDAGYMFLPEFKSGASAEIYKTISEFPKNVNGLVLDLRDNPGGLLTEANRVSAIFLERTALIEKIVYRWSVDMYFAAGSRSVSREQVKLPLVVLVDELSASASEIVAAALKDNKRAVIIGKKPTTFGKALVQHSDGCYRILDAYSADLLQGDLFDLTAGRIYRPNGGAFQGKGVFADIIIMDGNGEDIEKMMFERVISEKTLPRHLKGEEEGAFTAEEIAKLDLLKEDRQLYVALEVLKIMSGKEK